ncbi:MAG: glutamyl-tRNA reductase [Proteobacteria bacterium]|nr:glutamyl-tRNA reductase [Pseudomonadota bacterium]
MMLFACGLNHQTAPLAVREKFAFSDSKLGSGLLDLLEFQNIHEVVILSTCNRTELYCYAKEISVLKSWLVLQSGLPQEDVSGYLYSYQGIEAIQHMMRVASGLDSMLLGENQILGQMKESYSKACLTGTVGSNLQQVFQQVFSTAKRIRHETDINVHPISVAYAGAVLVKKTFPELNDKKVLLIGGGDTIQLIAKYLHQFGIREFFIANRTQSNVDDILQQIHGQWVSIDEISEILKQVDIAISATSCPLPFVTKHIVEVAVEERADHPLFLLDLAVPRDIEPEVAHLPKVVLYNLDDLQTQVVEGLKERQAAALEAEKIIHHELENFKQRLKSLRASDSIKTYRAQAESIRTLELDKAIQQLEQGQEPKEVISELSRRLTNKFLHQPSMQLRKMGEEQQEDLLKLAELLFCSDIEV